MLKIMKGRPLKMKVGIFLQQTGLKLNEFAQKIFVKELAKEPKKTDSPENIKEALLIAQTYVGNLYVTNQINQIETEVSLLVAGVVEIDHGYSEVVKIVGVTSEKESSLPFLTRITFQHITISAKNSHPIYENDLWFSPEEVVSGEFTKKYNLATAKEWNTMIKAIENDFEDTLNKIRAVRV